MNEALDKFLKRCISVDIEVNPKTTKIFQFAAVKYDDPQPIISQSYNIENAIKRLHYHLKDDKYIIGHNILKHDLQHLLATSIDKSKQFNAAIDTLYLNPVAFPRNPYHKLVKHHQDARLQTGHVNDPVLDAKYVFDVLKNQIHAFNKLNIVEPDALTAYHYLATRTDTRAGFDAVFQLIRTAEIPTIQQAEKAVWKLLAGKACDRQVELQLDFLSSPQSGWPLAYALSWISVAGGDSVLPPWVRMQFRESVQIVRHLRDTDCGNPSCSWCREMNDSKSALKRWFGYETFRPEPKDEDGQSLQEQIVGQAMRRQSLLGILPTGAGKSICYQIPALSKFDKTGALTVVISPLVALMSDQIQGMARSGISSAVTINGMLSLPERQDALDKVRMGDAAILLISPEQLRSISVRNVLMQREVGIWVLDEAHCLSKWGHDFRPDYRYVGRFIKEFSSAPEDCQVICLTATAKPEVIVDIKDHFQSHLKLEFMLLDGGAVRTNLNFEVRLTQKTTKLVDILDVIEAKLPEEGASGAIVYCATRRGTEIVAEYLQQQELAADFFHAGLTAEQKRTVQEQFREGKLRVIAATSAFGMGIDKPDIRLVVHGDIPSSLESYLQEAGRAGRDQDVANCVLLFANEDVERQFSLSAHSRLQRHEIGAILRALHRIEEKTTKKGEVVATSGEIIRAEKDQEFERDRTTDDTRVKIAVSWLEEAKLLSREENKVQVFPSSLQVRRIEEAKEILTTNKDITDERRRQLLKIVFHLMNAPSDKGISTDDLTAVSGLNAGGLNKAMNDLETLGIATNDVVVTIFVHIGVKDQSLKRFEDASKLEADLISRMQELAPDIELEYPNPLNLAETCQWVRNQEYHNVRPDIIEKILRSLAGDGRDQEGGRGNIRVRKVSRNTLNVALQRNWKIVEKTSEVRRQAALILLRHIIGKAPKGFRGKDHQIETTMGKLLGSLKADISVKDGIHDINKLMERALLWLHEQEVVTLGKGLTVFRPAMTVFLPQEKNKKFTENDFKPLQEHYDEQTIQTHVMATYAEIGLNEIEKAKKLSEDYFVLERDLFLKQWMPNRKIEIQRQTTGKSYQEVVNSLDNPIQQKIVTDDRQQTSVLVLAGPGSGKTRVLVHRIAYLIRVKREDPRGILVLTYNRHAAVEIRARLQSLIGEDSDFVTVSTCHALAMRLVGVSFVGKTESNQDFAGIIHEAVNQLTGQGLSPADAEVQRETLIQGYRWILVDEYQDIAHEEYNLISAVAGRSLENPELRLSLFAVGDDDQNIYSFKGASIQFIRKFENDYKASLSYLTENYRSTSHIINAANSVIVPTRQRMKTEHDIRINHQRNKDSGGGRMRLIDPIAMGRVQLLDCPQNSAAQAMVAVDELKRLSTLDSEWDWSRTAIIARYWAQLNPVRSYAIEQGIPVEIANEKLPSIWRLREMQAFINYLRRSPPKQLNIIELQEYFAQIESNQWTELIAEGLSTFEMEVSNKFVNRNDLIEWFAEWSRDARVKQRKLLLLTAHRAKGMEFDHVVILNQDWNRISPNEDIDASRRLFYVAMTRARQSLAATTTGKHPFLVPNQETIINRKITPELSHFSKKLYQYITPDLELVDLSYAGRLKQGITLQSAINNAKIGDNLVIEKHNKNYLIRNENGQIIGRMAKKFDPPVKGKFISGEVGAVVQWRKQDSDQEYHKFICQEDWEVILPELVYEVM